MGPVATTPSTPATESPIGSGAAPLGGALSFDVTLWRALVVFRLATLGYAAILTARNFTDYDQPVAGWVVIAVMAAWSAFTISAYARPSARTSTLLALDVAVARGRRWGTAAAVAMGACDLAVRAQLNQATFTGTVIMVLAAIAVGHVARLAADVQRRLQQAAELEAATRERERLARGLHDSVLQVLALVQRRGAELGGEADELGRLAGEQEAALRALVSPGVTGEPPAGLTDLRVALTHHAGADVSVAAPATAVWLPARITEELAAAVGAALDNVRRHGGPHARAWVLVEDESDRVTVTVRDDGPGIAEGRLAQAVEEGRLGVAQSIRGRIRDIGGTVTITSAPDAGTEVTLGVARIPDGATSR
jgi:signal transduction histidine kinase